MAKKFQLKFNEYPKGNMDEQQAIRELKQLGEEVRDKVYEANNVDLLAKYVVAIVDICKEWEKK